MTIKEAEQRTGLSRSNIRFYEKENLICPDRNTGNGYREYSEEDIKNIKKIAYLRTLGISIEDIRRLSSKEVQLYDVIKLQRQNLDQKLSELNNAMLLCDRMLSSDEKIDYEHLDIEKYIADVNGYWNQNNCLFKLDSIGFFYLWGGKIVWGILTIACLLAAVLSFRFLPERIPIQWNGDTATSFVDKRFIFAFPAVNLIIRFVFRPFIWRWISLHIMASDAITDYISNYLCFLTFSVQIFIILFVNGVVRHVTMILIADTVVLIGLLIMALHRMAGRK